MFNDLKNPLAGLIRFDIWPQMSKIWGKQPQHKSHSTTSRFLEQDRRSWFLVFRFETIPAIIIFKYELKLSFSKKMTFLPFQGSFLFKSRSLGTQFLSTGKLHVIKSPVQIGLRKVLSTIWKAYFYPFPQKFCQLLSFMTYKLLSSAINSPVRMDHLMLTKA